MNTVKFTEVALRSTNKKGIITPDENGYYTLVVGGLNVYNSAQEYYVAHSALALFESSSALMRRIKNGALYAELGHPVKAPSMSMEDYYHRVMRIDETNVCAHIKEVWLDMEYGKKNPHLNNSQLIAVLAKVKPAGVKMHALESALTTPEQNVAFSVRGITDNAYKNNRTERHLTTIVTWDYVIEPGISIATKWNSPVLEQLSDIYINKEDLVRFAKTNIASPIATEDSKSMYNEIIRTYESKASLSKLYNW